VRRSEYDTSDTYWASVGPRILSYLWLAHRNTCAKSVDMAVDFLVMSGHPMSSVWQAEGLPESSWNRRWCCHTVGFVWFVVDGMELVRSAHIDV
jgi:hypothetical protein